MRLHLAFLVGAYLVAFAFGGFFDTNLNYGDGYELDDEEFLSNGTNSGFLRRRQDDPYLGPALADNFKPDVYADDATWEKYIAKGQHFNCLMGATDQGAGTLVEDTRTPRSAASKWTDDPKADLKKWYWFEGSPWHVPSDCDFDAEGMGKALKAMGLNPFPARKDDMSPNPNGKFYNFYLHHNDDNARGEPDEDSNPRMIPTSRQKYKVKMKDDKGVEYEKEYTATGGWYHICVNKDEGAIVALDIRNPARTARVEWGREAAPDELPALRAASDLLWTQFIQQNNAPKTLKIYGAKQVVNDATMLLITRALKDYAQDQEKDEAKKKDAKAKVEKWPGNVFEYDSDAGKALIGSPLGAIAAHMLIQHKKELGIKRITKIHVFDDDYPRHSINPTNVHMFLEIEDVLEVDTPKDKDGDKKDPPGDTGGQKVRKSSLFDALQAYRPRYFYA